MFSASDGRPYNNGAEGHHEPMVNRAHGTLIRFAKNDLLFVQGVMPVGLHVVKEGRVKLSSCLADGKTVIVNVAGPSAILGLSAVILNSEYELSAEALEECIVEFIPRARARDILRSDVASAWIAAVELSRNYRRSNATLCSLAHPHPVLIKLARLIYSWAAAGCNESDEIRLKNVFTHQHIAEMIGTTRETVTRTLRQMREQDLCTLKSHELVIHDISRLKALALGSPPGV